MNVAPVHTELLRNLISVAHPIQESSHSMRSRVLECVEASSDSGVLNNEINLR